MIAPAEQNAEWTRTPTPSRQPSASVNDSEDSFAGRSVDAARSMIQSHPTVAVSAAVAVGLVAGWLIKRGVR